MDIKFEIITSEYKWAHLHVVNYLIFVTPWTVAHQTPLSMGFPRQEYWSWEPFPSPEDLPEQGIEPWSPALKADSLTSEPPGKPLIIFNKEKNVF